MIERPFPFVTSMIRATLEGHKTQSRRVIVPQPSHEVEVINGRELWEAGLEEEQRMYRKPIGLSPYGGPGDQLWVKESFWNPTAPEQYPGAIIYYADQPGLRELNKKRVKWTSGRFMPRWASRVKLEVLGIRAERLQAISNDDAAAEGMPGVDWGHGLDYGGRANYLPVFRETWDKINATRGYGWETNPWVWVISFKKMGAYT